jgi:hypothetical protein
MPHSSKEKSGERSMKLRLVSRLMVLALVVVVGVIILLHQHGLAGGSPRVPARPTPTSISLLRTPTERVAGPTTWWWSERDRSGVVLY